MTRKRKPDRQRPVLSGNSFDRDILVSLPKLDSRVHAELPPAISTNRVEQFAEASTAHRHRRGALEYLSRTTSRPFPTPETGKITVEVINHDGDEVMKVLEVDTVRRSCCR